MKKPHEYEWEVVDLLCELGLREESLGPCDGVCADVNEETGVTRLYDDWEDIEFENPEEAIAFLRELIKKGTYGPEEFWNGGPFEEEE